MSDPAVITSACGQNIARVITKVTAATPLITPPSKTFNLFIAWMSVMPIAASIARFMMPIPPPKYPPYTATNNSKIDAPATAALFESCEIPAEILPVRCLPNANSSVAPSNSHGKTFKKVCAGVLIKRIAPANPPITLVTISGIITRRGMFSFMRYAPPLAVVPTQSAKVFVALAGTGGTPVNKSAGNATKLPPPATALIAPPIAPAKNRNMALCKFKPTFYHDSRSPLQWQRCASQFFPPEPNSKLRLHEVPLSHSLTMRAGPYMNGAIYQPSATGCLARTLSGPQGAFKRKESQLR